MKKYMCVVMLLVLPHVLFTMELTETPTDGPDGIFEVFKEEYDNNNRPAPFNPDLIVEVTNLVMQKMEEQLSAINQTIGSQSVTIVQLQDRIETVEKQYVSRDNFEKLHKLVMLYGGRIDNFEKRIIALEENFNRMKVTATSSSRPSSSQQSNKYNYCPHPVFKFLLFPIIMLGAYARDGAEGAFMASIYIALGDLTLPSIIRDFTIPLIGEAATTLVLAGGSIYILSFENLKTCFSIGLPVATLLAGMIWYK